MRSIPVVFISYCTLALTVLLYMSHPTSADLLDRETVPKNSFKAVTLDLNNLDTANQTQKSMLFAVQGLVPGGFAVQSVRFKNTGSQTLSYQLSFQQTAGDGDACNALKIKVLRNWSVTQDIALSAISLSGNLPYNQTDDVVLAIGLDATDSNLQNKSCLFNLAVKAKAKDADDTNPKRVQFTDEELLQSQVSLGSWSSGQ